MPIIGHLVRSRECAKKWKENSRVISVGARFLSLVRRGDITPYGIKTLRKRETRDEIDAKKFLNHVLLIVCRTLFRLSSHEFSPVFFFSIFIRLAYQWPCTAAVCGPIQRIPWRRRRRNLINFQFFIRRRERERRKEKKWFDSQGIYSCTQKSHFESTLPPIHCSILRRCFFLCSGFFHSTFLFHFGYISRHRDDAIICNWH